jgi:hypothetical protein
MLEGGGDSYCLCEQTWTTQNCQFKKDFAQVIQLLNQNLNLYTDENYLQSTLSSRRRNLEELNEEITSEEVLIYSSLIKGSLKYAEFFEYDNIDNLICLYEKICDVSGEEIGIMSLEGKDAPIEAGERILDYLKIYWRERFKIADNILYPSETTHKINSLKFHEQALLDSYIRRVRSSLYTYLESLSTTLTPLSSYTLSLTSLSLSLTSLSSSSLSLPTSLLFPPSCSSSSDCTSLLFLPAIPLPSNLYITILIIEQPESPFISSNQYAFTKSSFLSLSLFSPSIPIILSSPLTLLLSHSSLNIAGAEAVTQNQYDSVSLGNGREFLQCGLYDVVLHDVEEEVEVEVSVWEVGLSVEEMEERFPEWSYELYAEEEYVAVEVQNVTVSEWFGEFVGGSCGFVAGGEQYFAVRAMQFGDVAVFKSDVGVADMETITTGFFTVFSTRNLWRNSLGFYSSIGVLGVYILGFLAFYYGEKKSIMKLRFEIQKRRRRKGEKIEKEVQDCK